MCGVESTQDPQLLTSICTILSPSPPRHQTGRSGWRLHPPSQLGGVEVGKPQTAHIRHPSFLTFANNFHAQTLFYTHKGTLFGFFDTQFLPSTCIHNHTSTSCGHFLFSFVFMLFFGVQVALFPPRAPPGGVENARGLMAAWVKPWQGLCGGFKKHCGGLSGP